MFTNHKLTATNLLIWTVEALLIALVGLYLTEYFGVPFVREAGGGIV
jgi:hypothetical protein